MTSTRYVGGPTLLEHVRQCSAFGTVTATERLRELDGSDDVELVVVDVDGLHPEDRPLLGDWVPPTSRVIYAGDRLERALLAALLRMPHGRHIAATHEGRFVTDPTTTVEIMLGRRPWSVDSYISGARVQVETVDGSKQRRGIRRAAQAFATEAGAGRRIGSAYLTAVDELVTNGLYDAPVGPDGEHLFMHLSRDVPVELGDAPPVRVELARNEHLLGVCVTDEFGSLRPEVALEFVAAGLEKERARPHDKEGGAGLGLLLTLNCASHLSIHVAPGEHTSALALLHLRPPYRTLAASSLDVFAPAD